MSALSSGRTLALAAGFSLVLAVTGCAWSAAAPGPRAPDPPAPVQPAEASGPDPAQLIVPQDTARGTAPLAQLSASADAFLAAQPAGWGAYVVLGSPEDTYGDNMDEQFPMASVAKLPIMLTFLDQTMRDQRAVSDDEDELLRSMIENSDNDSATELWDDVGGGREVAAYVESIGVDGMTFDGGEDWGDSTASPRAVGDLLFKLASGNILDASTRALAKDLLDDVETDQRWGVTAGFPDDASNPIALKNGWYPDDAGWRVNSAGWGPAGSAPVIMVVMTDGQESLDTGVATIEGAASRIGQAVFGAAMAHAR